MQIQLGKSYDRTLIVMSAVSLDVCHSVLASGTVCHSVLASEIVFHSVSVNYHDWVVLLDYDFHDHYDYGQLAICFDFFCIVWMNHHHLLCCSVSLVEIVLVEFVYSKTQQNISANPKCQFFNNIRNSVMNNIICKGAQNRVFMPSQVNESMTNAQERNERHFVSL